MDIKQYRMLINGEWVKSKSKKNFHSINPYNRKAWAEIPQATEEDINQAIKSARYAFTNNWKHVNGLNRAKLLFKLAELIEQNVDHLAKIETTDNGKIIRETKTQMHFAARNYRFFAGYTDKLYGDVIPLDNNEVLNYTSREPIGVAAIITSWNSPIAILANKLAPALAAGNSVVIKPSEHTSASTLEFGKLIEQAGFPKGVVNIITGDGQVGDSLIKNPLINRVSFTGGTETGRKIAAGASLNLTPLTLELGGKSPNIIFEDADIKAATNGAISGIFAASGQSCIAGSRLLVQKTICKEVIDRLKHLVKNIKLGNPLDEGTDMGPVATEDQFKTINSYIEKGVQEGGKLIQGERQEKSNGSNEGLFIPPTIFYDMDNTMCISREEIFGPVLSVIPFDTEKDAIRIANDSDFGLAAGIWSQDVKRVHRVAKEIDAGTIWINTYRMSAAQAPFGGFKLSGQGKERGKHALLEYTKVKNIMVDLSDEIQNPFVLKT